MATLTAHWTMDDIVGTLLNEESDTHDGTLVNGPTQDSGDKIRGTASLGFVAADSEYVTVPDHNAFTLQSAEARTISFFFKADNTGNFRFLFQKGDGYTANGEWNIYHYQDRLYAAVLRGSDGYDLNRFRSGLVLSDATWLHAVVTFVNNKRYADGGDIKIWIEKVESGVLHGSGIGSYVDQATDLHFGFGKSQYWSTTAYYDGNIDDVRFYTGELTQAEINYLYDGFYSDSISDGVGLSDTVEVISESNVDISDDIGLADSTVVEVETTIYDDIGLADIIASDLESILPEI
jgi:hypothetical protein